jgi:hypothetical protein
MPWFPNPNGGAPIQAATNPNPAGGSLGLYSDPSYNGPPPPGAGGTATPVTGAAPAATPATVAAPASAQLASGINSLLGAIASGNKQAFDEAVRQFNVTFGLDQSKFNESIRQFNQNFGVTEAGLTGKYQGQQTQQAQLQAYNEAAQTAGLTGYFQAPGGGPAAAPGLQPGHFVHDPTTNATGIVQSDGTVKLFTDWNMAQQYGYTPGSAVTTLSPGQLASLQAGQAGIQGTPTMAREQQTYAQQMGMINQAASLQANPFRQQQAIGQMSRLLNGQGVAGFSAPNTVAGVGTAGGNTQGGMGYLQQMISDIQNPSSNQASMQSVLNAIPTPNQINSPDFLRSAPSTQNMVLQGMQEKYGIDPNDAMTQIKNTLPQFQAPSLSGVVRR